MNRNRRFTRWAGIILVLTVCGLAMVLFAGGTPSVFAQSPNQIRVLESNTSHVVLELDLSSYDAHAYQVGSATYTLLSIPGFGASNQAGKPQLPIKGAMVGIPPGAQATLRIITDQSRSSTLSNPPLPAPTPQFQLNPGRLIQQSPSNAYIPNPAAYASNQLYPVGAARIVSTGDWRSQHFVTVEFHPLQYNASTHQLIFHQRLRVEIALSYPRGPTTQALGGLVSEGPFESVFKDALVNYASAKSWRSKSVPAQAPRAPATANPVSGGTWFKLGVDADGMYKVTCAQLATANGSALAIDPTKLHVFKQVFTTTVEYAINVVGTGWGSCSGSDTSDYVEFYGQAVNTKYTDTNVYWLTYDTTDGKRMATRDGSGSGTVPTTFTNTVHLEQNLLYRNTVPHFNPLNLSQSEGKDHWYWTLFYTPTLTATYPFTLYNPAGTGSASLQFDLYAYETGSHEFTLSVNSNTITDTVWTGSGEYSPTIPFDPSFLTNGSNSITVSEPSVNQFQSNYLNYFSLTYRSTFNAVDDTLAFQQAPSGTWEYQIGNFSNSAIEAFDVTDPVSVTRFVSTTVTPVSSTYTLQFADSIASPHNYVALASAQLMTPQVTKFDASANLRGTGFGADYIAIGYNAFLPNLQPLVNLRNTQFSRPVKVVDIQAVYDYFNDGVADPQAIRDFLYYAYQNWQTPAPSFVLLVGDGTVDPRGYCSTGQCTEFTTLPEDQTYIPAFLRMVDPYIGETASDNRFVSFGDGALTNPNTLPWMSIGRLPADSTSDVTAIVNKIVNYEQSTPSGSWRSRITFVADAAYNSFGQADSAGNFWAQSDQVASNPQFMPSSLQADRIYFNPCSPSAYSWCALPYPPYTTPMAAENAINSAISSGRLIVNYIGHGGPQSWSNGPIFTNSDVNALSNSVTPVTLEMTCYTGYFVIPNSPSLAEVDVRKANGGSVASWAATGQGIGELGHILLDEGFFDAVVNQSVHPIGLAADAGKVYLFNNSGGTNQDLIDTFLLLGDPATRLPIQFIDQYEYYLPFIKK